MPNILDLQPGSRRQIKKPAPMCLVLPVKLRKIAVEPSIWPYVSLSRCLLATGLVNSRFVTSSS